MECCILSTQKIMLTYKNYVVKAISLLIFQNKNNVSEYLYYFTWGTAYTFWYILALSESLYIHDDIIMIVLHLTSFDTQMSKFRDSEKQSMWLSAYI
jgi:hypothetical protein